MDIMVCKGVCFFMWEQKPKKFLNGKKDDPFKDLKENPLKFIGGIIGIAFIIYLIFIFSQPSEYEKQKQKENEQTIIQEQSRY